MGPRRTKRGPASMTIASASFAMLWLAQAPSRTWLHAGRAADDHAEAARHGRRLTLLSNAVAALGGAGPAMLLDQRPAAAEGPFDLIGGIFDPPMPADAANPPSDAQVSSTGLKSKMLLRPACILSKFTPPEEIAKCPRPTIYDRVLIDFNGWQVSTGKMFDSSRMDRTTVRVDDMIPGFKEALLIMSPGETRRIWIPADLAYGNEPKAGRPAGDLVLDVTMYDIQRMPKPPAAPQDVADVPSSASRTESGLAFQVLQAGTGSKKPTQDSKVKAAYSGWQTNGKLFMSTVIGASQDFIVKDIPIKGLTEGIQLMVEGEKRRFWIPPKLALGASLVFDFELLKVE